LLTNSSLIDKMLQALPMALSSLAEDGAAASSFMRAITYLNTAARKGVKPPSLFSPVAAAHSSEYEASDAASSVPASCFTLGAFALRAVAAEAEASSDSVARGSSAAAAAAAVDFSSSALTFFRRPPRDAGLGLARLWLCVKSVLWWK
jgi:hypothetical protein